MIAVFTDLDGTLLDARTYAWEAARPAIDRLRELNIPWVFVTSKTRAEVEHWRAITGNEHPFIVENGGAAFVPCGYFPFSVPDSSTRGGYEVIDWGRSYVEVTAGLRAAARISSCPVRGFHDMTVDEIAVLSDLPPDQAALAKQREYDEPFQVLNEEKLTDLMRAIGHLGFEWTRGGRFFHISGHHDKALAVNTLVRLYSQWHGPLMTVGLGDSLNDVPLLHSVEVPVLVQSHHSREVQAAAPVSIVTDQPGPEGWNQAILDLLRN